MLVKAGDVTFSWATDENTLHQAEVFLHYGKLTGWFQQLFPLGWFPLEPYIGNSVVIALNSPYGVFETSSEIPDHRKFSLSWADKAHLGWAQAKSGGSGPFPAEIPGNQRGCRFHNLSSRTRSDSDTLSITPVRSGGGEAVTGQVQGRNVPLVPINRKKHEQSVSTQQLPSAPKGSTCCIWGQN